MTVLLHNTNQFCFIFLRFVLRIERSVTGPHAVHTKTNSSNIDDDNKVGLFCYVMANRFCFIFLRFVLRIERSVTGPHAVHTKTNSSNIDDDNKVGLLSFFENITFC